MAPPHNNTVLRSFIRKIRRRLRRRSPRSHPRILKYSGARNNVLHCCVAYNVHGGYCVSLARAKRPAIQRILSGEIYEPKTLAFIRKHCADGDIVHAGTFFGDFLPALSIDCVLPAKIWAFEPNPERFRCAKMTAEINGIENIKLMHAGLSSNATTLPFKITDEEGVSLGGHSSFAEHTEETKSQFVNVSTVRLDEVIPNSRNVRILQLDVEGHEEQALLGSLETIRRCQPILILEKEFPASWFEQHLPGLKYEPITKLHTNTVYSTE